jgi:hypothetical protein
MFKLSLILTYLLVLMGTFEKIVEMHPNLVRRRKPLATVSWNE